MRGVLLGACAAALVTLCGAQASAGVIFSDNFEAETMTDPGNWSMNYNTFANFFVGEGSVDLLGSPNGFGLSGDGQYVDLDGSTGQGGYLETISQFAFNAGDLVTLSFSAGGNQREGTDGLYGGFRFFGAAPAYDTITLGSFSSYQEPTSPTRMLIGVDSLASTDPYQIYTISFRAHSAGSLSAVIGTSSDDNMGPLLDNVSLSLAAIPEPSSWTLLILGFGGVGALLRRRREVLALA
jgi:hypothetical protein